MKVNQIINILNGLDPEKDININELPSILEGSVGEINKYSFRCKHKYSKFQCINQNCLWSGYGYQSDIEDDFVVVDVDENNLICPICGDLVEPDNILS